MRGQWDGGDGLLAGALGMVAASLLAPVAGLWLEDQLQSSFVFGRVMATALLFVVVGGVAWVLTHGWPKQLAERVPAHLRRHVDRGLGAVVFAGWGVLFAVLVAGACRIASPELISPDSTLGTFLGRSSAYWALSDVSPLRPERRAEVVYDNVPSQTTADIEAMERDPRLRATLADPVVRRAIETGDFRELERRNRGEAQRAKERESADAGKSNPAFEDMLLKRQDQMER
jgi:hypothetical protein